MSFLPADHFPIAPASALTATEFGASAAEHFRQAVCIPTSCGRAALEALLAHLRLQRAHEVFITTTFDLPNVSSCVTCTVFNHCKPARVLTESTRAILVIHEFGVPHPEMGALRAEATRRGIPLIEDCAHTIASVGPEGAVGHLGDWVIASLPKVLPTTAGGLLLGPQEIPTLEPEPLAALEEAGAWWPSLASHSSLRREVFDRIAGATEAAGVKPFTALEDGIVPWFFPTPVADPAAFIAAVRTRGVDCGLWHGSNLVVLPCHQGLGDAEISAIAAAVAAAPGIH